MEDPFRRLAAAVILQALKDAQAGRPCGGRHCKKDTHACSADALDFLHSEGCTALLRALGLKPARLPDVLAQSLDLERVRGRTSYEEQDFYYHEQY